jgi:16S rRNA (uracil1498-N3)-methyltransferase
MHWESFYVNPEDVHGDELIISGEEHHHLSRVLRKKKGDLVWAVDGEGSAYKVKILYSAKNEARGKIVQTRRRIGEPVAEVSLAQGVLKGEKFDWLVEKTTELGIAKIIPFLSENSSTLAGPQKIARWKRVALAAMKQSGRSILPEITPAKSFNQVLAMGSNCHHRFIAHPGPGSLPLNIPKDTRPIVTPKALLIVGPEGGFTPEEIQKAKEHSFPSITLGSRRLRAETAGIVLSALLLSQLGELE